MKIPRSTIIFAVLSLILAASTSFVTWHWWYAEDAAIVPVSDDSIQLGLPGVGGATDDRRFTARSALLYDTETDSIVFQQNGFEPRPIASLTKLMTAMVALDHGITWEQEADIALNEYGVGGQLLLHPGEKVTMRDLMAASLVSSANNATRAYVRALGIPEEVFVQEMNRKAIALGLEQTRFVDVTGLDSDNVSTAYEVAILAKTAFTQYPIIAELTSRPDYTFTVLGSGREHTMRNSNKIISEWGDPLTGSKTGYIYEAGYCLVARGAGEAAHEISVILGSPSESEHFADTKRILNLPQV
ncbi:MAG: D-alanyl-D-alanine carboxypeptidase [Candidatus Andersenbacteria bacterium]|nr:D-alanyl-D-alanine carboxypeptidase [Candidatus Andersenbacteria bacterium]MBI3250380.1 D-alanyl-D-alanine carboxypeptidase [Candidatus Andersenbacteria bacterium]